MRYSLIIFFKKTQRLLTLSGRSTLNQLDRLTQSRSELFAASHLHAIARNAHQRDSTRGTGSKIGRGSSIAPSTSLFSPPTAIAGMMLVKQAYGGGVLLPSTLERAPNGVADLARICSWSSVIIIFIYFVCSKLYIEFFFFCFFFFWKIKFQVESCFWS